MCKVMEDMRTQTLQEGMLTISSHMLKADKYALDEIAAISGLPLDEVKRLQSGANQQIS